LGERLGDKFAKIAKALGLLGISFELCPSKSLWKRTSLIRGALIGAFGHRSGLDTAL